MTNMFKFQYFSNPYRILITEKLVGTKQTKKGEAIKLQCLSHSI